MEIKKDTIARVNEPLRKKHDARYQQIKTVLEDAGVDVTTVKARLKDFQVAIPSWALGAGGTRFGRFGFEGEPANLEQKLYDIGVLHQLSQTAGAVSLHIPWDVPEDYQAIKEIAGQLRIKFDAVNSNTFQDQPGSRYSYKFGSLCNTDHNVRAQAVAHNKEVIDIGKKLGSESITVWLADGSNFPGQHNFRKALEHTSDSLKQIYAHMPDHWKMLVEYKPYEPNFYSTVIQDWGTSSLLARECGSRALTLVDLGHHLPNTNIEQIVATLMWQGRLGGFHFNDSKFGDDDLTVGSIKPYALFLIFNELVYGMEQGNNPELAWMIDASHNLKDPLEDLLQSLQAIQESYAKALLVDRPALEQAQKNHDVTGAQELLQDAFKTDVRPLVAQARLEAGGALLPLDAYRGLQVRKTLVGERGATTRASGL